ncbi:hypothetical protein [Caulobacter sp. FWC2]|uniref:DUF6916 family protein n=1 Tax=Caulobacter sp. FWC2 TaxID=69664 RepID=UPI000C1517E8|nr:hypothetical protein [Caulobacter sp. FWC2]PIB92129.1 hypothetical protein CSW62_11450 [Caulobacter sp. FWC2]
MLETLTAEDFVPLIGQVVRFDQPDYQEALTVSEVIVIAADPPAGVRRGFIVVLEGSNPAMMISQGMYSFELGALGRYELLANCIGPGANGFRYQIVFG